MYRYEIVLVDGIPTIQDAYKLIDTDEGWWDKEYNIVYNTSGIWMYNGKRIQEYNYSEFDFVNQHYFITLEDDNILSFLHGYSIGVAINSWLTKQQIQFN